MGYVNCLGKTFLPVNLSGFYPNHLGTWSVAWVVAASGALLFITVLVMLLRKRRYLPGGWFWFLGTLVPVIGIVSLGQQAMADCYMYMPMTGLLIMVVWGTSDWCRNWPSRRVVAGLLATAAVAACLWLTPPQIATWKDIATLFAHAIKVTDRNHLAHNSLGVALEMGRQRDEALHHFQEALRIQPNYPKALFNLARAHQVRDELDEAVQAYHRVLELTPRDARAHLNLGVALQAQDKPDEAIVHYRKALQLNPNHHGVRCNLARALVTLGRVEDAVEHYREALRIKPDFAQGHKNLAGILATQGKIREAITHMRHALRIRPDDVQARKFLRRVEALQNE